MTNKSNPIAVLTIASANYLPYVRTLMQSVRDTNPKFRRYFILVDKKSDAQIKSDDLFEVIEAETLGIDSFQDMTIRYDVMELNTAVKPFAIEWLLDNTDAQTVIYLDPDICVYRRLDELERVLEEGASVVVTPHLTKPLEDGKSPDDHSMLQAGVFNLGFIAVARNHEAREFVQWWGRRLKEACHADFAKNLFTDQRWIDLGPCYLSDINVLRNPAYNVAYWNLAQRPWRVQRRQYFFDNEELAFFHFSGLQFDRPELVSKHQDRFSWKDIRLLHGLFGDYRRRLTSNGWGSFRARPYSYDRADDLRIVPVVRRLFRDLYPKALAGVPLDAHFILAMCNRAAELPQDTRGRADPELMHKVHSERPDLQSAFPLNSAQGVEGFVGWFEASAEREYGVDARLVCPSDTDMQQALATDLPRFAAPKQPNDGRPWLYRRWRKARKWLLHRI